MRGGEWSQALPTPLDELFDVVVESAKAGVRKPEPAAYELVLRELGVAADEVVFLDDLGINLKPARAMGMTTIKVDGPGRRRSTSSGCASLGLRCGSVALDGAPGDDGPGLRVERLAGAPVDEHRLEPLAGLAVDEETGGPSGQSSHSLPHSQHRHDHRVEADALLGEAVLEARRALVVLASSPCMPSSTRRCAAARRARCGGCPRPSVKSSKRRAPRNA